MPEIPPQAAQIALEAAAPLLGYPTGERQGVDAPARGATAPQGDAPGIPRDIRSQDVCDAVGGRTALRERYADAIRANAWPILTVQSAATAVLAVRDEDLAALRAEHERLLSLIRDLTDSDPCWLDHDDYCQTHGCSTFEQPCPHGRAHELLATLDQPTEQAGGGA